jgi:hypothetical protein
MNQSMTVEIINEGAMSLLRDMEYLRLIRVSRNEPLKKTDWNKYKGAMTGQGIDKINEQLNELRNAWE